MHGGDLTEEVFAKFIELIYKVAGIKIPLPGDGELQAHTPDATNPNPRNTRPYNPPALQTPSNLSDLESFKP